MARNRHHPQFGAARRIARIEKKRRRIAEGTYRPSRKNKKPTA